MSDRMGRIQSIHLVGIGGAGMAGIAEVLINLGYQVQGSDLKPGKVTARLEALGATVYEGHRAENLGQTDVVVVSSAVPADNPEIVEAQRRRIPVVQRAQMLAELMRFRYGIAIAGTHGKTTTTSLIASILAEAGKDPTYVIGGRLIGADSHAKLGSGKYLVAEADESDESFLHLQPMIAVVTNVDADHLESYGGDMGRLKHGFLGFLHNLPFYGLAVMCSDDRYTRELIPDVGRRVLSYGFGERADVKISEVMRLGTKTRFKVRLPGHPSAEEFTLNLPGTHNVLNAVAAITVADELGISMASVRQALRSFSGIDRRLQLVAEVDTQAGPVTFIDDYGHHPTEIEATLAAVRDAWPGRRLVVVFQPHRYTRTRALLDDFARVLTEVDVLLLTDVYAAGEEPLADADGKALARAVRVRGGVEPVFVENLDEVHLVLKNVLKARDVVLTLGAGNIGAVAQKLPELLGVPASMEAKQ
jgi:UDP-N-acetylmuramate--alanine ligase